MCEILVKYVPKIKEIRKKQVTNPKIFACGATIPINRITIQYIDYNIFIDKLQESNYIVDDLARGPKKYNGLCKYNRNPCRRIDIMYTKPEEYPFAILYFTGSMEFNAKMRG